MAPEPLSTTGERLLVANVGRGLCYCLFAPSSRRTRNLSSSGSLVNSVIVRQCLLLLGLSIHLGVAQPLNHGGKVGPWFRGCCPAAIAAIAATTAIAAANVCNCSCLLIGGSLTVPIAPVATLDFTTKFDHEV